MSRDRDDLAATVSEFFAPTDTTENVADAIIASGWRPPARVVTTVGELDALKSGTAVQDTRGFVWVRGGSYWGTVFSAPNHTAVSIPLPATVLWTTGE